MAAEERQAKPRETNKHLQNISDRLLPKQIE